MQNRLLCALSVPALSLALAAQVAPGIVHTDVPGTGVPLSLVLAQIRTAFGVPGLTVEQIEMRDLGNGTHRIAATCTGLLAADGGQGSNDCLEGTYNGTPPCGTVTKASTTAAINTAGAEFAFSIARSGLFAVLDTPTGIKYSTRANTTAAWAAPLPVTGIGPTNIPGPYGDSKLFYSNGVLCYAGIDVNGDVQGAPISLTGVVTTAALCTRVLQGANVTSAHSHEPMYCDQVNGNVLAWINSNQIAGGDSDSFFQSDKAADNAASVHLTHRMFDNPTWQANPTQFGSTGTTYWANSAAAYGDFLDISMVATNGHCVQPGSSTLNYAVWSPGTCNDTNPWIAVLAFGPALPGPVDFTSATGLGPSIGNRLGSPRPQGQLGITPLVVLTQNVGPGVGKACWTIGPVNLGPGAVQTQGFCFDLGTGTWITGNTAETLISTSCTCQ